MIRNDHKLAICQTVSSYIIQSAVSPQNIIGHMSRIKLMITFNKDSFDILSYFIMVTYTKTYSI